MEENNSPRPRNDFLQGPILFLAAFIQYGVLIGPQRTSRKEVMCYDKKSKESGEDQTTGRVHGHVRRRYRTRWNGRSDWLDRQFEFPESAGRSGGPENEH